MSDRRALGHAVLLMLFASAVSCRHEDHSLTPQPSQSGNINRSTELSRLQFDDVPVPEDFILRNRANESFVFEDGETRVGRLVYIGRGSERDVRAHYIEKLPLEQYGWKFVSGSPEPGQGPLVFAKKVHGCTVDFGMESGRLVVSVSVDNKN